MPWSALVVTQRRMTDAPRLSAVALAKADGAAIPSPATPARRSAYSPRVRSRPFVMSASRCTSSGTSREWSSRYFCRRADFSVGKIIRALFLGGPVIAIAFAIVELDHLVIDDDSLVADLNAPELSGGLFFLGPEMALHPTI